MPVIDTEGLIEERVDALRTLHRRLGVPRAELDVSGGVDSAVMLGLLTRALGPAHVTAVHSRIDSSDAALGRARAVAQRFGVALAEIDASALFHSLVGDAVSALVWAGAAGREEIEARISADPTILGSIRSTLRAPIGRAFNRLAGGGLRHGTGNECEDRWLRFFQKGGDGEVDTNPLAMLAKGEVYQLALALGVPRSILAGAPSPDLWANGGVHDDEDEIAWSLGLTGIGHSAYSYIDLETGRYARVGWIERVSRFADEVDDALFADVANPDELLGCALVSDAFRGFDVALVPRLLRAARRVERATRHKANPNCPTLGTRAQLVAAGLVTDQLPEAPSPGARRCVSRATV